MNEHTSVFFEDNQPFAVSELASCASRVVYGTFRNHHDHFSCLKSPDKFFMGLLEALVDSDFYHIHSEATRESREIYPLSLHRLSGNSVEEYDDKLSTGYDELYGPEQLREHTPGIDFFWDKIGEIGLADDRGTGNR